MDGKASLKQPFPVRIIASLLFLFLSFSAWAISAPIGSSPDEGFHLSSIWCAETPFNNSCEQSENGFEVPKSLRMSACYGFKPNVTGACPNWNIDVNEVIPVKHLNNTYHSYPVGFYNLMSLLKNDNLSLFVLNVRVLNSLIFIFGLLLLFLLVKNHDFWIRITIVQVVSMIPLGFFIIASANPSSWPMSFLVGFWVALYTIGKQHKKPFGGFNLFVVGFFWLGLNFSRSDGSFFSIVALLSLLILFFKEHKVVSKSYTYLIIGLLFLSFANFYTSKHPKSLIRGEFSVSGGGGDQFDGFALLSYNLGKMPHSFLGGAGRTGLGWLDTYVNSFVWRTLSLLIVFTLITSLVSVWQQKNYRSIQGTIFLILVYLFIPIIWAQLEGSKVDQLFQPRYMLPMVSLIILSSFIEAKISTRSISFYFMMISPILFLCYTLSLGTNIQRYSSGTNDPWSMSAYTNFEWSMFSIAPINILVVGSTFFALFLVTINYYYWEVHGKKLSELNLR